MNERLRTLRKKLGMTLNEFGEKLGVTGTAISRIEKGNRNFTEQMVISVCREFNVNEEWLRTGEGEMFVKLDPDLELMQWAGKALANRESFQYRFIAMLSKLSEDEWEWIAQKAQEIVDCKEKDQK